MKIFLQVFALMNIYHFLNDDSGSIISDAGWEHINKMEELGQPILTNTSAEK
jgi:hypothetical protein